MNNTFSLEMNDGSFREIPDKILEAARTLSLWMNENRISQFYGLTNRNPMTWTKNKPTKPGWYWSRKEDDPTDTSIFEITKDNKIRLKNGHYVDLNWWINDCDWTDIEWSSEPIKEPMEQVDILDLPGYSPCDAIPEPREGV